MFRGRRIARLPDLINIRSEFEVPFTPERGASQDKLSLLHHIHLAIVRADWSDDSSFIKEHIVL